MIQRLKISTRIPYMKKFIVLSLIALSLSSHAFDLTSAKDVIFKAVYQEHRCDEAEFYTQSVCDGSFLNEIKESEQFADAFEVTYEFEPNFFLHAIAFADGEVTVTYWSN